MSHLSVGEAEIRKEIHITMAETLTPKLNG